MKRIFIFLSIAALSLASCQKQSIDNNTIPTSVPTDHGTYIYTLTASTGQEDVKSDYDSDGKFTWSSGDAISVLFNNGSTNKFFTLTTTGTGSSASFSGEIDEGYTIGATDATESDKKIWVLFPASANHTYTAGSNPSFYVQPKWDFTAAGSHYSANVPMYAALTAEGNVTFTNLASTYKFIINELDNSVSRVKMTVSNQTTYALSGLWPIHADEIYLDYNYADPGSANSCLSYTAAVENNTVAFYVSCRYWGTFQPIVTIYNAENNYILKTLTATKSSQPTSFTEVQPITISAPGTGTAPFVPAINIDGDFSDWNAYDLYSSVTSRMSGWKATSDSKYIYCMLKMPKKGEKTYKSGYVIIGFNLDNDTSTGGSNYGQSGLEYYSIVYPYTNDSVGTPTFVSGSASNYSTYSYSGSAFVENSSNKAISEGAVDGDYAYIEIRIDRTHLGSPASQSTIAMSVSSNSSLAGTQTITLK